MLALIVSFAGCSWPASEHAATTTRSVTIDTRGNPESRAPRPSAAEQAAQISDQFAGDISRNRWAPLFLRARVITDTAFLDFEPAADHATINDVPVEAICAHVLDYGYPGIEHVKVYVVAVAPADRVWASCP